MVETAQPSRFSDERSASSDGLKALTPDAERGSAGCALPIHHQQPAALSRHHGRRRVERRVESVELLAADHQKHSPGPSPRAAQVIETPPKPSGLIALLAAEL